MSTTTMTQVTASTDSLVERLFDATIQAMDLFSVYLGDRLGYYRALAETGSATSSELSQATSTAERYTREWLEQQAATGILEVEQPDASATTRRYRLPNGYDEVLADPESLTAMAPMAQIFAGCVAPLPALLEAYRTGCGVPYEDYGPDLAEGQAGTTRPQFRHLLAQEWIPAMPDIHARLQAEPGARIADIGMGLGWSSIALAKAYPSIHVDGFDLDEASTIEARANAEAAGVGERVTFHIRDAGDPQLADRYDFALAIECIHDMSNPVAALEAMRRMVGDTGSVLVVDEKVADQFTSNADEVERYMYGFSILHCLPVSMVEQPSAATGTVMRSQTLHDYAEQAGFRSVEILPIDHDFFRFYRLNA